MRKHLLPIVLSVLLLTAVSVLLSGVVIKVAGVYGLMIVLRLSGGAASEPTQDLSEPAGGEAAYYTALAGDCLWNIAYKLSHYTVNLVPLNETGCLMVAVFGVN